ncbi:MAG: formyltransferase family protein [Bacteroidota bacterium]
MENSLKIIFVAFSENSLGRRIINMMLAEGITPVGVFMASDEAFKKFRKNGIRRYFKQNGLINTIWRIYYRLTLRKDLKKASLEKDEILKKSIRQVCEDNSIPLGFFDNINKPEFAEKLKALNPDLIILGGAPLIKKIIIDLPKIAVLNSHPGILPEAKGMDVVAQSLIDGVSLGATVFKVDEGIDSGPIILKRFLDKEISGKKLHEIEAMVEMVSATAMIEAIKKVISGVYTFTHQENKGKIYKALNYKTYNKVKQLLSK